MVNPNYVDPEHCRHDWHEPDNRHAAESGYKVCANCGRMRRMETPKVTRRTLGDSVNVKERFG